MQRHEGQSAKSSQGTRAGELTTSEGHLRSDVGQDDPPGSSEGRLLSPERHRRCIEAVRQRLGVSERRTCRVLDQHRSVQRHVPQRREDEDLVTALIIQLASQFGLYGYQRITALLRNAGWCINHKRVERIWKQEGLKVPQKQPKRGRIWLNDGSCVRLRPQHRNHVWAYDFVMDRTHDGRAFRMLTVIDEYTRQCLAIVADRRLRSTDVIEMLAELFIRRGTPKRIRSDNGPEFCAKAVLGRTSTVRASMVDFGMNCSTERSSTPSRRRRSSSRIDVVSTTRSVLTVVWATDRLPLKPER